MAYYANFDVYHHGSVNVYHYQQPHTVIYQAPPVIFTQTAPVCDTNGLSFAIGLGLGCWLNSSASQPNNGIREARRNERLSRKK